MGVVQEPFASTRRFEVEFIERKPRYCLRLIIHRIYSFIYPLTYLVIFYTFLLCHRLHLFLSDLFATNAFLCARAG